VASSIAPITHERQATAAPRAAAPAPLVPAALGLVAGIGLSEWTGAGVPLTWLGWLATGGGATAFVLSLRRELAAAAPTLSRAAVFLLGASLGILRHQIAVTLPPAHVAGLLEPAPILTRITGTIVTAPTLAPGERRNEFLPYEPPPRTRFVLAAEALVVGGPPRPLAGLIECRIDAALPGLRAGDRVELSGWLFRPIGPRNPGDLDWRELRRREGIHAALVCDGADYVRVIAAPVSWRGWIAQAQAALRGMLLEPYAAGDESAGVLAAIVLGQRRDVSRQANEAFVRTGTVHFLAVSGFNVALLGAFVWWLVRRGAGLRLRTAAVTTALVIVLYALLAEPNAPIWRAAVMSVLACGALFMGRPFASWNWLAAAVLATLLWSPLDLLRPGFQLSFLQVLMLLAAGPLLTPWLRAAPRDEARRSGDVHTYRAWLARAVGRALLGVLLVSAAAWLAAAPLSLSLFGRISPYGVPISAVLAGLVALLTLIGFVVVFVGWVPLLGAALQSLLRLLTNALLAVVEWCAALPGATVEAAVPPPAALVTGYYAALAAAVVLLRRAYTRPESGRAWLAGGASAAALGLLAAMWVSAVRVAPPRAFSVHVLAVGSGSATVLTTPSGAAAVFDLGTTHNQDASRAALRLLRTSGMRRIELATVSHANFDHFSGLPRLIADCAAQRVAAPPALLAAASADRGVARLLGALAAAGHAVEPIAAGARLDLAGVRIEVLWPPPDLPAAWPANESSLVLKLTIAGRAVLIPGDIESAAMRALLSRHARGEIDLAADVLIAPHHGSITPRETRDFLAAVSPGYVLVSTAKPRPDLPRIVAHALGDRVPVLTTRDCGALEVRIGSDATLHIRTPYFPAATAAALDEERDAARRDAGLN
jgi:competence protein ComEC